MKVSDGPEVEMAPGEIEFLNELLRESDEHPCDEELPEQSVLLAYFENRLSSGDTRKVQETLARSPRIREEVAYLARLWDPGVQKEFDRAEPPAFSLRPGSPTFESRPSPPADSADPPCGSRG